MSFREALRTASSAVRANLLPGLLLQCLMAIFFTLYLTHDGTRVVLVRVADWKQEAGFLFAFVSYVLASALLPELLRIAFFQAGRVRRVNVWNFLTAAPVWGLMGVVVDIFYRLQGEWFGLDATLRVILLKTLVDQFLFSPFLSNPLMVGYHHLRDHRFAASAWRILPTREFVFGMLFPTQVAGWMVWIPGVLLVYAMPPLLQIPVAVLIQAFWVLIFTTVGERRRKLSRK